MKVAIDLRPLQIGHQNRGIGAYLQNILRYFPADEGTTYIFLRYSDSDPVADFKLAEDRSYKEIIVNRYKFGPNAKQGILFLWGLIAPVYIHLLPHRPDIFFQSDYLLGIPSKLYVKKTILTCYDLIPLKFRAMYLPKWQRFASMRQLRLRSRIRQGIRAFYYTRKYAKGLRTCRKASSIVSISNTTTADLVKIARVKESRIHTIYLAPSYRDIHDEISKLPPALFNTRYIFYIGGSDKRRQIASLISAFNKLNARGNDTHLVLAGNEFAEGSKDMSAEVRTALALSSYSDKIHLMGVVSEGEKYELMKNAAVFAYPSLYEGFGLPIVEAMLAGTPVVTYRNSSIEEIGSDDVFYAEESSDGIYDMLKTVLNTEKDLLSKKSESAKKNASRFSWDEAGKQTWALFLRTTKV